jgi:hypothetical protein
MANNVKLTPYSLGRFVMMNLGGMLHVAQNMNVEHTSKFAKKGAKAGDTVGVRKPQRFVGGDGLAYEPEPIADTEVQIKVAQVSKVHFDCNDIEKTLSFEDINEDYGKPIALSLANKINARAAKFIAQNTFNSVGTPGTVPTSISTYLSAGTKLVQLGLPENEDLSCIINRKMSDSYVVGNATVYNPASKIGGMFNTGVAADESLGYRWWRDQTIYTRTTGIFGGTPLINGNSQVADGGNNGTMVLLLRGWTATSAIRLNAADKFTILGVYSVHPQTRASTGDLQQFVVLADTACDGSGNMSVTVAPAITPSGQSQNVTAAAADGAAITLVGAASTTSTQGILMHKNAFGFLSVPFENPGKDMGVDAVNVRDPKTGLSISIMHGYSIEQRKNITRADCLYDFAWLYREMACMIESQ